MVVRKAAPTTAAILLFVVVVLFACRASELRGSNSAAKAMRAHAHQLAEQGDVGEAIEAADQAAQLAPGEAESRAVLAHLHTIAGHTREARAIEIWCVARAFPADAAPGLANPE